MRRCSDEALLQPIDTARSQVMVCLKPLLPLQYLMVFKTHNKLPRRICPRSASCLSSPGAGPAQCSAQRLRQDLSHPAIFFCDMHVCWSCLAPHPGLVSMQKLKWDKEFANVHLRNMYISSFLLQKKYPQNLIQFEIGTLVLAKIFRIALFVWRDPRFF